MCFGLGIGYPLADKVFFTKPRFWASGYFQRLVFGGIETLTKVNSFLTNSTGNQSLKFIVLSGVETLGKAKAKFINSGGLTKN